METGRRSSPVVSQSWQRAKIALQSLSLVCCVVVLGLGALMTGGENGGTGILAVTIAAATAAWTLAELGTFFVRRRRQQQRGGSGSGSGIHPGAHVAMQLVIFLALILTLFYSSMLWRSVQRSLAPCNDWARLPNDPEWAVQTVEIVNDRGYHGRSSRLFHCPQSFRDRINNPTYRACVQAVIAFCALLWVIHFSLFVRACVETQRRNRDRPTVVAMYPQAQWPAPYGPGHPYGGGPAPVSEVRYR